MAHLIYFFTSKFDPSKEPRNEINPIPGKSALDWLKSSVLTEGFICTEPDYEDWGWYMDVEIGDASYMVGACCYNQYEEPPRPGRYEWTLQIRRNRTLRDMIFRKNKIRLDDALSAKIFSAVQTDAEFQEVHFETGP